MRDILFRGKQVDTGEWEYGFFATDGAGGKERTFILDRDCPVYLEVIPDTVGQFTGLTDKNGTKIFEGDIVKAQDNITLSPFCYGITGAIEYDEACFFIAPEKVENSQGLYNECADYEVIGNIHDNPELLKGEMK